MPTAVAVAGNNGVSRSAQCCTQKMMHKGGGRRSAVQKHSVCCRRESDVLIVPLQQTACSALTRGSGAPKLVLMSGFNLAHAASFRFRVNLKDLCTMLHPKDDAQRREGAEWGSKMLCLLCRKATRISFPYNKQCIARYRAVLNLVQ